MSQQQPVERYCLSPLCEYKWAFLLLLRKTSSTVDIEVRVTRNRRTPFIHWENLWSSSLRIQKAFKIINSKGCHCHIHLLVLSGTAAVTQHPELIRCSQRLWALLCTTRFSLVQTPMSPALPDSRHPEWATLVRPHRHSLASALQPALSAWERSQLKHIFSAYYTSSTVMWTQVLRKASKAVKSVITAQFLPRKSSDSGIITTMKIHTSQKHLHLKVASWGSCPSPHSVHRELEYIPLLAPGEHCATSTKKLLSITSGKPFITHSSVFHTILKNNPYESTNFHCYLRKCLNFPVFHLLMKSLVKYVIRNLSILKKAVKLYEHSSLSLSREWKALLLCS